MHRRWIFVAIILCIIGLAPACGDSSPATRASNDDNQAAALGTRELPTLYPTATAPPVPSPTDTRPPQPTTVPATEVPFDQVVADVRYSIPVLNLDRRIRGNVAGEIEIIDEETSTSVTLRNRAGVLLEMQQALPRATIEESTTACEACVYIEYRLPLTEQAGEGWLNDVQMLASLESYTSMFLGPHFPPGTIIGLRREATPFEVAHSAALTDDGGSWAWKATEAEIGSSTTPDGALSEVQLVLDEIEWENLADSYGQVCYDGGGRETLMLASPDGTRSIELYCPDLFLPGQLQALYLRLSALFGDKLEESDVAPPELPFSVDSQVIFQREDGAKLDLKSDGRLNVTDSQGITYTSTVTMSQILSLTAPLLNSALMEPGVSNIMSQEPGNVIVLRADDGVYELAWIEVNSLIEVLIRPWDDLLEGGAQFVPDENGIEPEQTATSTATDADDS